MALASSQPHQTVQPESHLPWWLDGCHPRRDMARIGTDGQGYLVKAGSSHVRKSIRPRIRNNPVEERGGVKVVD